MLLSVKLFKKISACSLLILYLHQQKYSIDEEKLLQKLYQKLLDKDTPMEDFNKALNVYYNDIKGFDFYNKN